MISHINEVNPNELVVALFHPKLLSVYKKFSSLLIEYVRPKLSEQMVPVFDQLEGMTKGLGEEGFKLKMQSLGLAEDLVAMLVTNYSRYINLQEDDYKSLFFLVRNFILNEAIKKSVNEYNSTQDIDKLIDSISSYRVTEFNDNFNDEKLFTTSTFGDIDLSTLEAEFRAGIIHSSVQIINDATPLGGYLKGQMFVFGAPTKAGKSLIAMRESIEFLKQDLNVVYSAFGDLKKWDHLVRMSAQINNHPFQFVEMNLESEVQLAIKKVPQLKDNLLLQYLAPDKFTATDYVSYIKESYMPDGTTRIHNWVDVIIVDYDANIHSPHQMYLKGEDIYQTLYQLTYPDKLLIVLAQTNKFSWDKEIIGLADLGESSRKQQIVDGLMTISRPNSYNIQNQVGWMNLCAGRRVSLMRTPYFRDIDGNFYPISTEAYGLIKSTSELKTFIPDIETFSNYLPGEYTLISDRFKPEYIQDSPEDNETIIE